MLRSLTVSMLLLAVLCLASCISVQEGDKVQAPAEKPRDGVFIHVSHGPEEAHRVLMALSMAEKMSEDKNVLLYFDIKGVYVLLKDAEDISFSHFPASKTQIAKLLEKGVGIYACPGCLKAAEKSPEDLMEGIQVADKAKFFSFTEGRILTLDY
jgi:predicted peroxiredoxin